MNKHLSDQINSNIAKSEQDGGFYLRDLLPGDTLNVQTCNTAYKIHRLVDDSLTIVGNAKYCPKPTPVKISGSTWRGSMIKQGFVGVGMYLEYYIDGERLTSSQIKAVDRKQPAEG